MTQTATKVRLKIHPLDADGNVTAEGFRAGWRQTIWRGHEFVTIKWDSKNKFHFHYWIDGNFGNEDGFETLKACRQRIREVMAS